MFICVGLLHSLFFLLFVPFSSIYDTEIILQITTIRLLSVVRHLLLFIILAGHVRLDSHRVSDHLHDEAQHLSAKERPNRIRKCRLV